MRCIITYFNLALIITIIFCNCTKQNNFPVIKGDYLGQKPPGKIPEIFAPGIITTEYHEHSSPIFSRDGKEVYWSVFINFGGPQVILCMTLENEQWTAPQVAPFSGQYTDGTPFFSYNGKKLYFESRRPIDKNTSYNGDIDLWVVEKIKTGWSAPKHLGMEINSNKWERGPSVSKNGNLYFSSMREGGFGQSDIYCSRFENGNFLEPKNLGKNINTEDYESWPFIAPDESYIIYESYTGDLFINFRKHDDSWTDAINMAEKIKSTRSQDRFPHLSNDGKYLFFVSNRLLDNPYFEKHLKLEEVKEKAKSISNGMGNVYWIDASIINELKPKEIQ